MFNKQSQRSGFTLPEVLVTIAIVAVLAAAVVPTVTQQLSKGDDSSVTSGLTGLRTSVTEFVADTRKFPGALDDIFTRPLATADDAFGADYGTQANVRWNGPYSEGTPSAAGIDFGIMLLM